MAETLQSTNLRPSRTKIVATVGPACAELGKLIELLQAGVDVFRINMAHGSREEHQQRVAAIGQASQAVGAPAAILVDLAGPKMRLGEIPGGVLECTSGSSVKFIRGPQSSRPDELVTTYEPLLDELHVGDRVLLADGTVALDVERVEQDSVACRVAQGGTLRSRQGVNLPGIKLIAPTLGPQDRDNAEWAAEAGADYLGLSFVRAAEDVRQLKALIEERDAPCQVIAKIEKPEALAELDAILAAADGIMVARGDLGVEIDIAELAVVQKRIVAACHQARKPVIVATQMLESMTNSRLPTRAEATDVANAIMDGADACMLSGETAIGKYPREAVEMMHRIALATEPILRDRPPLPRPELKPTELNRITEATTYAAGRLAEELDAKLLVVVSASGKTALDVSKNRPLVPTVGISDNEATLRRMCLYWGVIPLAGTTADDPRPLLEQMVRQGRLSGWLGSGDHLVMIFGTGIRASRHNAIVVYRVE